MIDVLIADDEPLARRKLRQYLEPVAWAKVVAECGEGEETIATIDRMRPHLVFLDVRMPGASGIEVLRRIAHRPMVVFTTAYDRYAVTAFELAALDYLLKPFGPRRFKVTLERVRAALDGPEPSGGIERALDALGEASAPDRVFVREAGRIVPIALSEIERFEARDDYVLIHAAGRTHLAAVRMQDLERRLDPARFLRVHRSHIVNLDHVTAFDPHPSGRLVVRMRSGARLFASRSRSHELRDRAI